MVFAAVQESREAAEIITGILPLVTVLVPLAGSLLVLLLGYCHERLRNHCAVLTSFATFVLVLSHYPLVRHGAVEFQYARVMQFGVLLRVDFFGFVFAALFAAVWFLATVYATVYMSREHAQTRFYVFLLSTLGHCLGVVMSGDLFSLFLFFELMTFSSYVLVIHEGTPDAMRAGAVTLYLGVIGGLCLLMGVFLLYFGVGTLEITPLFEKIAASSLNPYAVMTLFVIGFGVKAGMAPLHIWLPKAHPVAPSPASALLSGIMIKAGAYGIFRVVGMIFTPAAVTEELAHKVLAYNNMGHVIIWLGVITMFLGAFMALLSTGAKKVLAYSSVSQMGYILLGIGSAAYLGFAGPMGFAGALYHIINHAFFKAGLFMMVGSVYMITHDLDITRVRGMGRRLPVIAAVFLVAFAGVGGIPGFNGYVSKTILHHAIVEAYEHHHALNLLVAEKIFVLTSAMTLCYFTKLFSGLFLGPTPEKLAKKDYRLSPLVYIVLGIFGAVITGIGLAPGFLLDKMVIPAMAGFTYDAYAVKYLGKLSVWNWPDLREMLVVLVLAAVLYSIMLKARFFRWEPPHWLSIEYLLYRPLYRALFKGCRLVTKLDRNLDHIYETSGKTGQRLVSFTQMFDGALNEAYEKSGRLAKGLAERAEQFDSSLNEACEKSGRLARRLADKTAEMGNASDGMYEQSGARSRSLWERMRGRPGDWNIKNLNFDSLLMALMLGLFLFILIYYTRNI
jgi:formate hydrogenlyase subunit 3/multisubunit Na+/H+ antiporter MnhD subunit